MTERNDGNHPRRLRPRLPRHVLAARRGRGRAASCASRATPTSPSPPASPAPRSTATPSSCIRPSASRRRCGASAPRARASSRRSSGTRRSTRSPARWQAVIAESGPLALLGYAYSAHQGQMNRGLLIGLFHALGASRLLAGTVCDTCCEEAWDMTVGPVGGADPEVGRRFRPDHLLGRRSRRHQRAFLGPGRGGAKARASSSIVIDPRKSRTGRARRLASADPHRHRRGAGARHHAHPGARRPGRPRLYRRAHARLRPARGARCCRASRRTASPQITGLTASGYRDASPRCTARQKRSFIRLGEGMTPARARRRRRCARWRCCPASPAPMAGAAAAPCC